MHRYGSETFSDFQNCEGSNFSSKLKVRKSIKNDLGAEEIALLVKCLPSRQEDLSLTSIAHAKKAAFMTYAWNTSTENVETDRS